MKLLTVEEQQLVKQKLIETEVVYGFDEMCYLYEFFREHPEKQLEILLDENRENAIVRDSHNNTVDMFGLEPQSIDLLKSDDTDFQHDLLQALKEELKRL